MGAIEGERSGESWKLGEVSWEEEIWEGGYNEGDDDEGSEEEEGDVCELGEELTEAWEGYGFDDGGSGAVVGLLYFDFGRGGEYR